MSPGRQDLLLWLSLMVAGLIVGLLVGIALLWAMGRMAS